MSPARACVRFPPVLWYSLFHVSLVAVFSQGAPRVGFLPSYLCYSNRPPGFFVRSLISCLAAGDLAPQLLGASLHSQSWFFQSRQCDFIKGSLFLLLVFFEFCSCGAWIVAATHLSNALESPDEKTRGYMV
jgi:hypothetical protein